MMELNLSKEKSIELLNLRKDNVNLLCLEKPAMINQVARVAVVMDFSGSMGTLYRNGTVQAVLERLLPIAMQFDDNGEMELWLFDRSFRRMPNIALNNFYGYVQNEILNKGWHMGTTSYAPVMRDVFNKYMAEDPQNIPDYVIFITDGANDDKALTTAVITEASKYPIFWQFVGIGSESFPFLERLDDLDNRYVDNADYFALNDFKTIDDRTLYSRLLNEFPGWLSNPLVASMPCQGPVMGENPTPKKKGFLGLF